LIAESAPELRSIGELFASGEIVEIQDGNHGELHPKADEYTPDGVPFLMAKDVQDGRIDLESCNRLPQSRTDMLRIGFARSGDVLLTHKGSIGRSAVIPPAEGYFMLTPQVTYYRVNREAIDRRYLSYAFRCPQFQDQMEAVSAQSTRAYIGITAQRHLKIFWWPVEAQRKIASVLSGYDDLIENNRRCIAILEEMARRLYQEWFVSFRFPGHEKVKMIDSPMGKIPRGWEILALGDVCEKITDGAHASPRSVENGLPMASVKDLTAHGLTLETCRRISVEDFAKLVRSGCQPRWHDVLIAKDGATALDTVCRMEEDLEVVLLSSVAILRACPDRVLPCVLHRYLADEGIREYMKGAFTTGAAIPRVVLKDFARAKIIVPPADTQDAFGRHESALFEQANALVRQNAVLRRTRDYLVPKLVSGEVDVSELDIKVEEDGE